MPNLMVALSNIGGDGAAMAIFWRPIFAANRFRPLSCATFYSLSSLII